MGWLLCGVCRFLCSLACLGWNNFYEAQPATGLQSTHWIGSFIDFSLIYLISIQSRKYALINWTDLWERLIVLAAISSKVGQKLQLKKGTPETHLKLELGMSNAPQWIQPKAVLTATMQAPNFERRLVETRTRSLGRSLAGWTYGNVTLYLLPLVKKPEQWPEGPN